MNDERSQPGMSKTRLEAFSDGVIAIIITIMVLELKVPHTADFEGLKLVFPVFLSYVLSFIYVGIYWNNHHHMLSVVKHVGGGVFWANLPMLFWLSLFPFATGWMGENHFELLPTALYGLVLMMCAIAYVILQFAIVHHEGRKSLLATVCAATSRGRFRSRSTRLASRALSSSAPSASCFTSRSR